MKNITLRVEDEVLAIIRRYAAQRNSSVNAALVREYLTNLAQHQGRAKRVRARLQQLSAQSRGRLGQKTWTR